MSCENGNFDFVHCDPPHMHPSPGPDCINSVVIKLNSNQIIIKNREVASWSA